jgi:hypothetical protein
MVPLDQKVLKAPRRKVPVLSSEKNILRPNIIKQFNIQNI